MTQDDFILLIYIAVMLFLIFFFRNGWLEDRELKRHIAKAETDKARENAIQVYRRNLEHRTMMMAFTFIGAVVISIVFYWSFAV
jgi:uncharacterized membrane protein